MSKWERFCYRHGLDLIIFGVFVLGVIVGVGIMGIRIERQATCELEQQCSEMSIRISEGGE